MLSYKETFIQEVVDPALLKAGVKLFVKREDLNHQFVTGNKWWKLKYNLEEARNTSHKTLLTFGGAYSNHIYATAAAAKECGFKSIGLIRGEETLPLNGTLSFAKNCGMELYYISRKDYQRKNETAFIAELESFAGRFYLVPEGGTNTLAVKGVSEFATTLSETTFDYLCVPVGTGGTLAGIVQGLKGCRQIVGYASLKDGSFLKHDVENLLKPDMYSNWKVETKYHHGGYAKVTRELISFLNTFEEKHNFRLDPVYTGKMMWGIFEDVKSGVFPAGSTILAIHTGGIQGWNGIEH